MGGGGIEAGCADHDQGAELVVNDERVNYRIYKLAKPLYAGRGTALHRDRQHEEKGFENDVSVMQLNHNGSFFNNMELLPAIGYNTSGELQDRADRRKHGLPPNDRMPKLTADPAQRMQNYLMAHSDWMTVRTTISTSPDQIAIAPGSLKKEWTADGKRYFQYELDHKSMNFFSFMSARYEVAREKWNDVDLEVYYQKEHVVNVPRMLNSMRKALTYYTEALRPYSNKQARIIEFPRYARASRKPSPAPCRTARASASSPTSPPMRTSTWCSMWWRMKWGTNGGRTR
jgi:ABC-2 type transport system permease protein